MKIIHITTHLNFGGAARAAKRVNDALIAVGIDSEIWHSKSNLNEYFRKSNSTLNSTVRLGIGILLGRLMNLFFLDKNEGIHSINILNSRLVEFINNSEADLIHLHWFQDELLSISDISKITKPVVWTLHDMWGFCGAEHLSSNKRFIEGYTRQNRLPNYKFFDFNEWTWKRKQKYWHKPMHIITPSNWLLTKAHQSALMNSWEIVHIPHPINTSDWKPMDRNLARKKLNLNEEVIIISLGSIGVFSDSNKGLSNALESLNELNKIFPNKNIEILIYGQRSNFKTIESPFKINYFDEIKSDDDIRHIISSSNLTLIPSYIESFSLAAQESLALGIPVVCFNSSGIKELILHKKTGYLAKPFSPKDLAQGMAWVLTNNHDDSMGKVAKEFIDTFYTESIVALKHRKYYEQILINTKGASD